MSALRPSERSHTPEEFDELYSRVWEGFSPEQQRNLAESYNQLNGHILTSIEPAAPNGVTERAYPPSSTPPSTKSPRARRPLPRPPGSSSSNRPYSEDQSSESRRFPVASTSRAQSVIGTYAPSLADSVSVVAQAPTSVHETLNIPPWQGQPSATATMDDLDDSSSLYPSDSVQPLPMYEEKEQREEPPAPAYEPPPSEINGVDERSPGPSVAPRPGYSSFPGYSNGRRVDLLPEQRHPSPESHEPSIRQRHGYQSSSNLSYVESIQQVNDGASRRSFASSSASIELPTTRSTFYDEYYDRDASRPYPSSSAQYLDLRTSSAPGSSSLIRRPTDVFRELTYGSHTRALELHDDIEDEYYYEDEEEPDRFVNFSLLSHLAVQLRDKVPRGTHVKGSIPYPRAFTGKDIVSTIQSQITRELYENHRGTSNDRRAALQIARSLQSQLMFYEVEWGGRILQDGVEDVYMFLDDEEGGPNPLREGLPTSVVTILARCYSPSCGEGPECYAYGCPRKGDSLRKLLPSIMEAPSGATREAWPRTVSSTVLNSLTENEIRRQTIIHKLISKEEIYVKDLDLVDSLFIQPLRRANPPVITPPDRLDEFIEIVFHNILDVRECNRRFLEVLNVRRREQAPVIGDIGDIVLGIAADFRDPYPAYIGNHPIAERKMKDELENNPEFRLFIEKCSRQQHIRSGADASMRLDLRHFLNRPAEHLQKYPVLLEAIYKATARGNPDAEFLTEAIVGIKNLHGVARLRTFQSAMGKGPTGKWGWQDLVSQDVRPKFTPEEVKRQSLIFDLVKDEMLYVKDLENIGTMYIRALKKSEPPIIPLERLDRFIKDVFHNFAELRGHHQRLVNKLHEIQRDEHPKIKSITDAVCGTVLEFREAYLAYIPNYPIAAYRIEEEADRNPNFKAFIEDCVRHPDARRNPMKDFLNCPLTRLLNYTKMLREILDHTPRGHEDQTAIPPVIEIIETFGRETEPGVAASKQRVQLWTYNANLVFRPNEYMDLDLLNENRALMYTGKLFRQPEAGSEGNGWDELYALLFDNYLVLTRQREQDGLTKYDVARRPRTQPMPLDLLTPVRFNDHPLQRGHSTNRNHRSVASSTSASTSSNSASHSENGDTQPLYPFTIHHNGRLGGPLNFYTELSESRANWRQRLEEAIGLRRVVQESNKVFEIETLSMHTFSVPPIGLPLPPNWTETNAITGKVTCSIPFNTPDGRRLVAIGCAEGVWIGFRHDSTSMCRVLHLKSVTQCTMLDDFGLFIVLANKQLNAYHIEALVPTPNQTSTAPDEPHNISPRNHEVIYFSVGKIQGRTFLVYMRKKKASMSHFYVEEPVLERIQGQPRQSRNPLNLSRDGWFRRLRKFSLPRDTYDLIFLRAKIAILSKHGFEIMNLLDVSSDSSTVIPHSTAHLRPIIQRHESSRPIGIFRSGEDEFLLCYSEFGIYVDKQGAPSREACVTEWEGNADTVAFHAPYVLLFDQRFVEIRHVETGRLAQVIMGQGQDIRCVWDGRGHSSNPAVIPGVVSDDDMVQEAHIHAVMNYPDSPNQNLPRLRPIAQHVFELIPTIPLYLPGSLSSPSTVTYFPYSDSFSPPRSPQLRPSTSYAS